MYIVSGKINYNNDCLRLFEEQNIPQQKAPH